MHDLFFILISGKTCSGKDALAACIKNYIDTSNDKNINKVYCEILPIAKQLKKEYSELHGFDVSLFEDYDFKTKHREGLTRYGELERSKFGVFIWNIKLLNHVNKILKLEKDKLFFKNFLFLIPDLRHLQDIHYFRSKYKSFFIRIEADECQRKKRGWQPTLMDLDESETLLDNYASFDMVFTNNRSISEFNKSIISWLDKTVNHLIY